MKIAIAGGQTGGPIVPLLAIVQELKDMGKRTSVLVFDVPKGAGHHLAQKNSFHFKPLHTGKLRRYWSWRTLLSPFAVAWGVIEALYYLGSFRPDLVLGAGGFVQAPVVLAAWFLHIPVLIHQQDVRPSLSNILSAPIAKRITTTFEESIRTFSTGTGFFRRKKHIQKVLWTGNPFRESLQNGKVTEARKHFKLDGDLPIIFITGGGSGATALNSLVYQALPQLKNTVQVIHGTGPGKMVHRESENYHPFEFIDRMDLAYAAADLVVSRAGISTITELANLGKVSIIIPMPKTHQEENAMLLFRHKAAIILKQESTTADELSNLVRRLLLDGDSQKFLKQNISGLMPKQSAKKIAKIALEITGHDH